MVSLFSMSAFAKSYVWTDPDFEFTVAYPDMWKAQGGLSASEKLEVLAPDAHTSCLLEAFEDRRYVIYPRTFDVKILAEEFNWSYWEDVTANYDDRFFYFDKQTGLDKAEARYTLLDYKIDEANKRGFVFATIYDDLQFLVRCESSLQQYEYFLPQFMKLVKSIEFKPAYAETKSGYYRNFLGEKDKKVKRPGKFKERLFYRDVRPIYTAD